jgi:hypothetical protein
MCDQAAIRRNGDDVGIIAPQGLGARCAGNDHRSGLLELRDYEM